MKQLLTVLFTLISIYSIGQLDSVEKYRLLNEIIKDNFADRTLKVDRIPCNDRLKISHGWIQQNFKTINENLDKSELRSFLKMIDPTGCFLELNELSNTLDLCDSTKVELGGLLRKFKIPESTFKWKNSKFIETKGGNGDIYSISEPLINDSKSFVLIHVVFSTTSAVRGETLLFKKVNNKWTQVCTLDAWVT
jgi:hypothetical protein